MGGLFFGHVLDDKGETEFLLFPLSDVRPLPSSATIPSLPFPLDAFPPFGRCIGMIETGALLPVSPLHGRRSGRQQLIAIGNCRRGCLPPICRPSLSDVRPPCYHSQTFVKFSLCDNSTSVVSQLLFKLYIRSFVHVIMGF
uniref:Uncharacterized protein n=1 Tax=Globodera rostochiensis TaxID=31243 RepID=A0A914GXR3_GLORO